ncbi:MAG: metal-dependent hydrolase [Calditrichaeota bacterium]|nr:metal-dependent hydrolase [Calditrichota bacterium]
MPDLTTHLAFTHLVSRPIRLRGTRVPVYVGALLPDLLTRPFYILYPPAYYVVYTLHTPVAIALMVLLLTELCAEEIRRRVMAGLFAGVALHFALDLLQRQLGTGYYWLFPFSWKSFALGLFWPEESLRAVPFLLAAVAAMEAGLFVSRKLRPQLEGTRHVFS